MVVIVGKCAVEVVVGICVLLLVLQLAKVDAVEAVKMGAESIAMERVNIRVMEDVSGPVKVVQMVAL